VALCGPLVLLFIIITPVDGTSGTVWAVCVVV